MNGRVALVTGGGRGIGREAALLLSAAGARVMVVSRSATELAAVGLEYVAADLGTPEGCALAVAETERRLGPIDVLVVNHGIGSAHERLVWEQDPEVWRETMRINLDGPFELARLTVGGMCQRGFGRLVFTSSTAGEKAERSGSAYTASKHGVIGLARAVAQDAGPFGVTSNAVLPGWVRTAMAERSAKTEAEALRRKAAEARKLIGSKWWESFSRLVQPVMSGGEPRDARSADEDGVRLEEEEHANEESIRIA